MTYQKYCTKPATFIYNTCGCLNGKWYDEITKSCVNPSECKCPSNLIWVQEGILKLCNKKEKLIHNGCVCPVDLFYDTTLEKCVTAKSCTGGPTTPTKDQLCKEHDPLTEYRSCQSSSCVLRCDNLNPIACTDDCMSGCFCQKHLVQVSHKNKTCVAPVDCPSKPIEKECSTTMVFTNEGRLYYCGNKDSDYKKNDCVCPPGYRYDRIKKICVEPCDCSYSEQDWECFKKDPNTEYYDCKSNTCLPTCQSQYPDYCNKKCTTGCHCKPGLMQVSETNTSCVVPSECPKGNCCIQSTYTDKCTVNKRCDNMFLSFSQALCDGVKRCVCNDGYVMNSKQECVLPQECKPEEIRCPQNMEYSTCHGCEKQCDNLNPICTEGM
ncbi:zonadhesin-like [Atheta coriaria]|uniref:zonadhesin-like n=1 Tax=Dalotia coriaria TaxID=877792 RepID=UPI0031F3E6D3